MSASVSRGSRTPPLPHPSRHSAGGAQLGVLPEVWTSMILPDLARKRLPRSSPTILGSLTRAPRRHGASSPIHRCFLQPVRDLSTMIPYTCLWKALNSIFWKK